ncbi:hypothetical protein OG792_04630 [Micromonospora sp. NBC_01699]|uniref:hypothetical protein n=1 Tax=Micromonospora sp. NBC_01699 TaxID=2975984 RepID=UPI002E316DD2|nr:hypothetical protein [Micromonospora sp. NBC_01699]
MDSVTPRSCTDHFWNTDAVDPVDTVAERLMTSGTSTLPAEIWDLVGCLRATDPMARDRAVYRAAVLAALAARYLLGPGVVTASVIGTGLAAQLQTVIFARHVPCVSHVSVFLTDTPTAPAAAPETAPERAMGTVSGTTGRRRDDGGTDLFRPVFDPRVVDELDLAGIVLVGAASPAESAFGANLVVVGPAGSAAGSDSGVRRPGAPIHLAKGALLVNASGRDLPPALADQVGQVFVDDLTLVETAADHGLARPANARLQPQPRYRLVGDLREVVLGRHVGRTDQEQVLLVELLSSAVPARC